MRLYLDTSALVKLYVEEDGSDKVREQVRQADVVATSAIAYVEARAALARRHRERSLSPGDYRRTVRELDADWQRYVSIEVTDVLIRKAADLAGNHRLRAYDAIHLASAAFLTERLAEAVAFSSWDANLSAAARREGLEPLRLK